jgi:hypothetical protein
MGLLAFDGCHRARLAAAEWPWPHRDARDFAGATHAVAGLYTFSFAA